MGRSVIVALIAALIVGAVSIASAGDGTAVCCACESTVNGTATTALFCVSTHNEDTAREAALRCEDSNGIFNCVVDGGGSCQADLAGIGITCPAVPAPAAGDASLLALIVALVAGGALFLHRARRKNV